MTERRLTIGTWVKRFLIEHLPTERNLAVNTLKSYRDCMTLLLPFAAKQCGKPVERLNAEDLSADCVTAFLAFLERERGCSPQTRNQRLAAIRSLARYVSMRDAALVEWAGGIRAIPLKKTVRSRIGWLSSRDMEAMIAGPDGRTAAGRVEHACLLFLYNSGARASEAAGLQVADLHLPERSGENARVTLHGKGGKIRVTPVKSSSKLTQDSRSILTHLPPLPFPSSNSPAGHFAPALGFRSGRTGRWEHLTRPTGMHWWRPRDRCRWTGSRQRLATAAT